MLYVRYPLSLRNVEDLLHERGIKFSHETVRFWWTRFDPIFAAEIRRKRVERMRSLPRWRWHPDEVFLKINGITHSLWRAVDHEGAVLEALLTKRRDRKAALKFLRKTMKRHGHPHVFVADRLRSYGAEGPGIARRSRDRSLAEQSRGEFASRTFGSHRPFRRRERALLRFRQMRSLQKFVAVHSSIHNLFNGDRALISRDNFKASRRSGGVASPLHGLTPSGFGQTETGSRWSDTPQPGLARP
jgi:putative transposase